MFNTSNFFNGLFGKVKPGMCRLTMNGGIAVKCTNGYKTYNLKKKRLTNVDSFCFDLGSEFFFIIPTQKVAKGDIILVEGRPKCVIEATDAIITVIDYESSEIRQVVPEHHIWMGCKYYYGKIVSMFGGSLKGGKGLGRMMKMALISQMFNNNGSSSSDNMISGMLGGNKNAGGFDMGQMMAMSMLMGGDKDDLFSDMFSGLSFDDSTDDDDEEEEETPKKED